MTRSSATGVRLVSASSVRSEAAEADLLVPLLKDSHPVVRTTAATALFTFGKKDTATNAVLADVNVAMNESSLLHLLNTLRHFDVLDQLPKNLAREKSTEGAYNIRRFFKDKSK